MLFHESVLKHIDITSDNVVSLYVHDEGQYGKPNIENFISKCVWEKCGKKINY